MSIFIQWFPSVISAAKVFVHDNLLSELFKLYLIKDCIWPNFNVQYSADFPFSQIWSPLVSDICAALKFFV